MINRLKIQEQEYALELDKDIAHEKEKVDFLTKLVEKEKKEDIDKDGRRRYFKLTGMSHMLEQNIMGIESLNPILELFGAYKKLIKLQNFRYDLLKDKYVKKERACKPLPWLVAFLSGYLVYDLVWLGSI